MIQAVVLAGGRGTRLRSVTGALPKPLALANGRALLDLQLTHFAASGIRNVLVLTGYGAEQIAAFCGDGSAWGLSVRCWAEPEPLGTAGAVLHARSLLDEEFTVTYADTVFDFDVQRLVNRHRAGSAVATLLVHPNDHPRDSDLVEVNDADRILAFHPYPHPATACLPNLVNAGVYVLRRDLLDGLDPLPPRPDFGKHVFPRLLATGAYLQGYRSPEYVKDAGTPERLSEVSRDLASGRVARKSLRAPQPAVFLDRDGTLNREKGGISRPQDVELLPGAAAAVARLNESEYRTVIVTNQAVIARGECAEADLQRIHNYLETLLGAERAFVDRIYYCPHIPDRGFPGERLELKIHCECRKPGIGMVTQAARDLNLRLDTSWLVGDSTGDVETARRAGMLSVLLSSGHGGGDGKWPVLADFECVDLADAVDLILERWPRMLEAVRPIVARICAGDVVLLAGQARSGKSQYAAALRRSLEAAGKQASVVGLDSWLRSAEDRRGPSVLDRYDLPAATDFLRRAAGSGGQFRIARYDRRNRRQIPDAIELQIPRHCVLILEGVPALASSSLSALAKHRIAITRSEQERLAALWRDYTSRGWSPTRISKTLAERMEEEFPVIRDSLESAHFVIHNGPEP